MPTKDFEHTISFYSVQTNGNTDWIPLVVGDLVQSDGNHFNLSLLFDTGASFITLRHNLYPILGLSDWNVGQSLHVETVGSSNTEQVYLYHATFEFFGKTIDCPVVLTRMPPNPLYHGLFGRAQIFEEFGFGFWENTHELYVNLNP